MWHKQSVLSIGVWSEEGKGTLHGDQPVHCVFSPHTVGGCLSPEIIRSCRTSGTRLFEVGLFFRLLISLEKLMIGSFESKVSVLC